MISIVVTVYNKEKFIENTLNSIFNQTDSPSEIIIINDGSTDRSLEIINNIQLPNFAYVLTTKNQGVSASRNLGLKKAKSKYIHFVDGDDILKRDSVSIFKREIQRNPNYILYAANRISENHRIKKRINAISSKEFDLKEYLNLLIEYKNLCWTSAVVINKSILKDIKYNIYFSRGEDRYFYMKLLSIQSGYWIDKIVAVYVNDSNSLSSTPLSKNEDLFWIGIKEHTDIIDNPNFKSFKTKYILSNIIFNLKRFKFKNAISWLT
jgi:glycosyltransferase involved in cell wall biosynthesis